MVPWAVLEGVIEPHYPKTGRKAVGGRSRWLSWLRKAGCEQNLAPWNCHALQDEARCRLPKPVPDLIVKRDFFLRRVDMDVVPQTIEELGAVGLRIDGVYPDVLAKDAALRTLGLGLISTPLSACHTPASRRSGPRFARSSGETLALGKDVRGKGQHRVNLV